MSKFQTPKLGVPLLRVDPEKCWVISTPADYSGNYDFPATTRSRKTLYSDKDLRNKVGTLFPLVDWGGGVGICLLSWKTPTVMDSHRQGINTSPSLGEHEGSSSSPRLKEKRAARGWRRVLQLTACLAEVTGHCGDGCKGWETVTVWFVPSSKPRAGAVGAGSAQGRARNYSEE